MAEGAGLKSLKHSEEVQCQIQCSERDGNQSEQQRDRNQSEHCGRSQSELERGQECVTDARQEVDPGTRESGGQEREFMMDRSPSHPPPYKSFDWQRDGVWADVS